MTYVIEEKQLNKLPDFFVIQMAGSDNVKLIFEDGTFIVVRNVEWTRPRRRREKLKCKKRFA